MPEVPALLSFVFRTMESGKRLEQKIGIVTTNKPGAAERELAVASALTAKGGRFQLTARVFVIELRFHMHVTCACAHHNRAEEVGWHGHRAQGYGTQDQIPLCPSSHPQRNAGRRETGGNHKDGHREPGTLLRLPAGATGVYHEVIPVVESSSIKFSLDARYRFKQRVKSLLTKASVLSCLYHTSTGSTEVHR